MEDGGSPFSLFPFRPQQIVVERLEQDSCGLPTPSTTGTFPSQRHETRQLRVQFGTLRSGYVSGSINLQHSLTPYSNQVKSATPATKGTSISIALSFKISAVVKRVGEFKQPVSNRLVSIGHGNTANENRHLCYRLSSAPHKYQR